MPPHLRGVLSRFLRPPRMKLRMKTLRLNTLRLNTRISDRRNPFAGTFIFVVLCAALILPFAVPAAIGATGLSYKVEIKGVDGTLETSIQAVSRLLSGRDKPPAGFPGSRPRADADQTAFTAVLRSEGYYDSTVDIVIDDESDPAAVRVNITLGPRYPIAVCEIVYTRSAPEKAPKDCRRIGIRKNQPARSADILDAEAKLVQRLLENGRPDAKVEKRTAIVDHKSHTMRLTWKVDPGPPARFGAVRVSGTTRTKPEFLARIVPWQPGAEYDVRKLDDYRQRLSGLNLFDQLSVAPDTAHETASGLAPILVNVKERAPRSFGGGVTYATDEGPGASVFWEHRNWWGEAETLRFDLALATIEKSLTASLTLPHSPRTGQMLTFSAQALNENTDAYRKTGAIVLAKLTTPLGGKWKGDIGAAFQAAQISQGTTAPFSMLLSLPANASFDSTNSIFDPTRGERLNFHVEPVFGNSAGLVSFLILQSEGSAYRALDRRRRFIVAGRAKLGTILLAGYDAVPADMRFYSGGGGSVRGYDYQAIGPHDALGTALGGRALAETSLELRYRITESFGAVAFVDAGTVSRSPVFADAETPRIGAGLGVRYYTALGPIRLDLGVPVNRGGSGSPVIKIYVSLGQAF
ncbi:MAG: outer membrane protein assembly factor [Alphaproteobacteria bacterium]|nr:outer membrane protein assembly factor [Alphaproteobacteria bacterium]